MLSDYIDKYLTSNKSDERYYYTLRARRKYISDDLRNTHRFKDSTDLKQSCSHKKDILKNIQKYEVKRGLYTDNGIELPENALCVSLYHNPRNINQAKKQIIKTLIDDNSNVSPVSIALSNIQKSKGQRIYSIFDFDIEKTDYNLHKIIDLVNTNIGNDCKFHIVETRGGFHLLIRIDSIQKPINKKWFNTIQSIEGVDKNVSSDCATCLVGTYQGGHLVTVAYSNW